MKPFYIKVSPGHNFKKNSILNTASNGKQVIVLNSCCKDHWWRKIGRRLGFTIQNIEGLMKVKLYEKK
jgi:hypothetical protein